MLAERIKYLRESKGLTQAAFAKALGISGASVGYYENKKTKPGKVVMESICEIFDVTEEWLKGEIPLEAMAETTFDSEPEGNKVPAEEEAKQAEKNAPVEEQPDLEKADGTQQLKEQEEQVNAKKTTLVVESSMGGSVTIDDIISSVRIVAPDATEIYVKPEENKAYWVGRNKKGSVDLWD